MPLYPTFSNHLDVFMVFAEHKLPVKIDYCISINILKSVQVVKKVLNWILIGFGGLAVVAALGVIAWVGFSFLTRERIDIDTPDTQVAEGEVEEGFLVNLYFGHDDATFEDHYELEEVQRETDSEDLVTFSMEELISGPNQDERTRGLVSALVPVESSQSTCDGEDLLVEEEDGVFKFQVCRETEGYDDLVSRAIASAQVSQTMSQFPDVDIPVLLNHEEDCFYDPNDDNSCYQDLPESLRP